MTRLTAPPLRHLARLPVTSTRSCATSLDHRSPMRTEAMFLPVPHGGRRFCLFHTPQGAVRALVFYIHPFAEEMNKSRRMAALQARSLAEAGFAVLQLDLLG